MIEEESAFLALPAHFGEWLKALDQILSPFGDYRHESELILLSALEKNGVSGVTRADLISADPRRLASILSPTDLHRLYEQTRETARHRSREVPLQYLLGEQYFYGRKFYVDARVLIPRPETEGLVEHCLRTQGADAFGLEIGLGSGAISLTLLAERPRWRLLATEVSEDARQVAEKNRSAHLGNLTTDSERLRIHRVHDLRDVFDSLVSAHPEIAGQLDFMIANPPYLLSSDEAQKQVSEYEPACALFAPAGEPLYFYDQIAKWGGKLLRPRGKLYLEIPHERSGQILALFKKAGYAAELHLDLNQNPRVLTAGWVG